MALDGHPGAGVGCTVATGAGAATGLGAGSGATGAGKANDEAAELGVDQASTLGETAGATVAAIATPLGTAQPDDCGASLLTGCLIVVGAAAATQGDSGLLTAGVGGGVTLVGAPHWVKPCPEPLLGAVTGAAIGDTDALLFSGTADAIGEGAAFQADSIGAVEAATGAGAGAGAEFQGDSAGAGAAATGAGACAGAVFQADSTGAGGTVTCAGPGAGAAFQADSADVGAATGAGVDAAGIADQVVS